MLTYNNNSNDINKDSNGLMQKQLVRVPRSDVTAGVLLVYL